jgi:Fe-Mn family superoxide dismutase
MNRRQFIEKGTLAAVAAGILTTQSGKAMSAILPPEALFTLPPLPYDYSALEPHIDAQTMQLHHDKHHAAYIAKLNDALTAQHLTDNNIESICANISKYDMTIRNNGGGHYNHSFFWKLMKPGAGGIPTGKTAEALNNAFGNFDTFKKEFSDAAMKRFGSGWAWLVKDADGKLKIGSTPNQDNPLMDVSELKGIPLAGIDVWEHAYYLKYQNKRADYINAFWNVINWDEVAAHL